MKIACPVALLLSLVLGTAHAGEFLTTLKEGSWLCSSPDAYDIAIEEQRKWEGGNLDVLKKDLLDRKLCMYVDAEYVEKMMIPFAQVLERQGTKVRVQFTVEFRKRLEILHRFISRVTYAGWTDAANLRDKEIL
jgi:hypothetical protein